MSEEKSPKQALIRDLALFTVLRLLAVVVVTAIIWGVGRLVVDEVPVLVCGLFAVIIVLPLSMIIGAKLRSRINLNIGLVDEARRTRREELRSQLRGEK